MSSIETLKNELIYQKNAIESKGGTVHIAGTNPSPSEISLGIDSIEAAEVALATATPEDVKEGKSFFAGNNELKQGTLEIVDINVESATATPVDVLRGKTFFAGTNGIKEGTLDVEESYIQLYLYDQFIIPCDSRYSIRIPDHMKEVRSYFLYRNPNNIDIYLNPNIEYLNAFCFSECENANFYGFEEMNSLIFIGSQAFMDCKPECFDLGNMPNKIQTFQLKAFQNIPRTGYGLNIPYSVTTFGAYTFYCDNRVDVSTFEFSPVNFLNNTLSAYCFYNIGAHYDFVVPNNVTSIGASFNYNGSFDNVSIGLNIKTVSEYAFGGSDNAPISNFFMRSLTFHNPVPPSIGNKIIALQHLNNDFKIYVPDSSIEEYKAVSKLATLYGDYIHKMSERN